MQKWEYAIIEQSYSKKTKSPSMNNIFGEMEVLYLPLINLNKLGDEGWELINIVPTSESSGEYAGLTHKLRWVFKRPKQEPESE